MAERSPEVLPEVVRAALPVDPAPEAVPPAVWDPEPPALLPTVPDAAPVPG